MRKSLVKLTAVAASSFVLAGAVAPVAPSVVNAQNIEITDENAAEYLQEALNDFVAADEAAKIAQANLETAEEAYNDAVDRNETALAELALAQDANDTAQATLVEAQLAVQAAQETVDGLVEAYDVAVTAANQAYVDAELAAAHANMNAQTTANQPVWTQEEVVAAAQVTLNDASASLTAYQAQFEDPAEVDQAILAELQSAVDTATTALTTAQNTLAELQNTRDNELALADDAYYTAVEEAAYARDILLDEIEFDYYTNDRYDQNGSIPAAQEALTVAREVLTDAEGDATVNGSALTAAEEEAAAAATNLSSAEGTFLGAQVALANRLVEEERALARIHYFAANQQVPKNEDLVNLTDDQRAAIEEILGLTSEEVEDRQNEAEENLEDLEDEFENHPDGSTELPDNTDNDDDNGSDDDSDDSDDSSDDDDDKDKDETDKDKDHGKKDKHKGNKKHEGAKVAAVKTTDDNDDDAAELPATGEASNTAIFGAAALSILAGLGLVAPKFKKEDK